MKESERVRVRELEYFLKAVSSIVICTLNVIFNFKSFERERRRENSH